MKCLNCGKEIGLPHFWKKINGKCVKVSLCWKCRKALKDCIKGAK